MRPLLIVTALPCEARPLIEHLALKPSRGSPIEERFQVFHGHGVRLAVTGMGRLRSAIATSALISLHAGRTDLIVANVGIAGAHPDTGAIGDLRMVNKVTDSSSGLRYFPDILLRHGQVESALETRDEPVLTPPLNRTLVDMEGAGFAQAATTFVAPSQIVLLKIISDHCKSVILNPAFATELLSRSVEKIVSILESWRTDLPCEIALDEEMQAHIRLAIEHAHFSETEQHELFRIARFAHAHSRPILPVVERILATSITCRSDGKKALRNAITELRGDLVP